MFKSFIILIMIIDRLGSMVGMFKYCPVDLYAACDPPPVMEFTSLSEDDWLKTEAKDVCLIKYKIYIII